MTMTEYELTTEDKITIRKNWGYHDGVADRLMHKLPRYHPVSNVHPFDRAYGDAYWLGYAGEQPVT